jgi:hypothetical protein
MSAEQPGGEQFEGGATSGMADFSALETHEVASPDLNAERASRNQEAAALFQRLLEEENQVGHPMPEADEAPEMSMDVQSMDLQGMKNYMDMSLEGSMADGSKANQLVQIAQDGSGQWLYKDTIVLESGKTMINTAQAATLALLRAKILDQLHQGDAEKSGIIDESDEDEARPSDLKYKLEWDPNQKGYHVIISSGDRANIYDKSDEIPEELQDLLSEELSPYWTINFKNQNAFIQKTEIYFGSFIDEILDRAWDKDLTSDRERARDDTTVDILVSNGIKDYNRLKLTQTS